MSTLSGLNADAFFQRLRLPVRIKFNVIPIRFSRAKSNKFLSEGRVSDVRTALIFMSRPRFKETLKASFTLFQTPEPLIWSCSGPAASMLRTKVLASTIAFIFSETRTPLLATMQAIPLERMRRMISAKWG